MIAKFERKYFEFKTHTFVVTEKCLEMPSEVVNGFKPPTKIFLLAFSTDFCAANPGPAVGELIETIRSVSSKNGWLVNGLVSCD